MTEALYYCLTVVGILGCVALAVWVISETVLMILPMWPARWWPFNNDTDEEVVPHDDD